MQTLGQQAVANMAPALKQGLSFGQGHLPLERLESCPFPLTSIWVQWGDKLRQSTVQQVVVGHFVSFSCLCIYPHLHVQSNMHFLKEDRLLGY